MALRTDTLELAELTTEERDLLTPIVATVIYNTTDGKLQLWNGTSWVNLPSDVVAGDPSLIQINRTTPYILTVTPTNITFDQTMLETNAAIIEHDDVNTERIILNDESYFNGSIDFQFNNQKNTNRIITLGLYKNESELISFVDIEMEGTTHQTIHRSLVIPPTAFVAGDYLNIKISVDTVSGPNDTELLSEARVIISKMD